MARYLNLVLALALALALAASTDEYAAASDDDVVPAEERADQRNRPRIARRTADPAEKDRAEGERDPILKERVSSPSTWTLPRLPTCTQPRSTTKASAR